MLNKTTVLLSFSPKATGGKAYGKLDIAHYIDQQFSFFKPKIQHIIHH